MKELIVWTPLINQMVVVAYPVSKGHRIPPNSLPQWMRQRDLAWICPCTRIEHLDSDSEGAFQSCRVVTNPNDGVVYAFCAHMPPKCDFVVNISNAFQYATHESEYSGYPATVSSMIPDIKGLRQRFINSEQPSEALPYFEGYFGERAFSTLQGNSDTGWQMDFETYLTCRIPRVKAMRDSVVHELTPMQLELVIASPKAAGLHCQSNSEAGLSSHPLVARKSPAVLSVEQYNLLATLGCGEGITFGERDYLFETCDGCGLVFVTSAIRHHVILCRRRHG